MKRTTLEIEQAVKDFQAGKAREENFRLIYECHRTQVFNFLARRGFSSDQCHELTQKVFIRVFTGIAGFRGGVPFGAWLIKIAASVYKDDLRSRTAYKRAGHEISLDGRGDGDEKPAASLDPVDPSLNSYPLDVLLVEERRRLLYETIMKLPEQMRNCMILHVHQEMSYQEIALVMGLSVEAVKSHLYQARLKMKASRAAE
jgi:RNA polymerase sigma factor (sigma-70 family)